MWFGGSALFSRTGHGCSVDVVGGSGTGSRRWLDGYGQGRFRRHWGGDMAIGSAIACWGGVIWGFAWLWRLLGALAFAGKPRLTAVCKNWRRGLVWGVIVVVLALVDVTFCGR